MKQKNIALISTVLISLVIIGGVLYYHFINEHIVTGKIIKVAWECHSCNSIIGIDLYPGRAHITKTWIGEGRTAICFTSPSELISNEFQLATFFITLETPLGERKLGATYRRMHTKKEKFKLPINLPPDGTKIDVTTTLSGYSAKWTGLNKRKWERKEK